VFDDSGDECDTTSANIQAHSGFCTASCKDKSLEFLAGFGSVCGPNIADTFLSAMYPPVHPAPSSVAPSVAQS